MSLLQPSHLYHGSLIPKQPFLFFPLPVHLHFQIKDHYELTSPSPLVLMTPALDLSRNVTFWVILGVFVLIFTLSLYVFITSCLFFCLRPVSRLELPIRRLPTLLDQKLVRAGALPVLITAFHRACQCVYAKGIILKFNFPLVQELFKFNVTLYSSFYYDKCTWTLARRDKAHEGL